MPRNKPISKSYFILEEIDLTEFGVIGRSLSLTVVIFITDLVNSLRIDYNRYI